jgi:hypothetical protein
MAGPFCCGQSFGRKSLLPTAFAKIVPPSSSLPRRDHRHRSVEGRGRHKHVERSASCRPRAIAVACTGTSANGPESQTRRRVFLFGRDLGPGRSKHFGTSAAAGIRANRGEGSSAVELPDGKGGAHRVKGS